MGRYHCCLIKALRKAVIAALVLGAMQATSGQSAPVTLMWNPNRERDIAGYRLYYGTDPCAYTDMIDVGNTVTATVSNLPKGIVHFFAVTAYNTAGFESLYSDGVAYPVSTPPVHDNFDRADGELGPNWTKDTSWGSGLSISGNKVVATSSGVHYWNANTFGADQYSQIRLTGAVGSWSGVFVRGNPRPAAFYLVRINGAGADLYSWSNGIFTQLAHDATGWASGDVLRLAVRTVSQTKAHLTVYRNGAELFSYDDTASFIAGGQPGIGLHNDTVSMSLDDWEGGELASGPF